MSDHRTRQRLVEATLTHLSSHGLTSGLLGEVAARAGISLDRARIFFQRDEELVLALYVRFATDLEAQVVDLPPGTVAERFHAVMRHKFAMLSPFRDALAALTAAALDPRHELGALNPQTEVIRARVQGVFAAAVTGAIDAPSVSEPLVQALYAGHLALMLLWCQDRSEGAQAANAALDFSKDLLSFIAPFIGLPEAAPTADRLRAILTPLLGTDPIDASTRARSLLQALFSHRRTTSQACQSPCPQCFALHLPRAAYFVRGERPLHLILPAFPAKSPSRRKTLGPRPDAAEEVALRHLQSVCDQLTAIHSPGVRLTICSDGHVFSDLVGVTDAEVTQYGHDLGEMIGRLGCHSIDTFSMSDLYDGSDYVGMRHRLIEDYGQPVEEIEQRAAKFDHARSLFNGIHRFIFEEQADIQPERSRTKLREECRGRAYRVIQHSEAWGRLLADCFPMALRLSIHPQHPHAEKIGILLGPAADVWLTPWHGCALHRDDGWILVKRQDAEAAGAVPVMQDGRPWYLKRGPT